MSDNIETREGGCFCGAVRYRVTGKPAYVGNCHCRDCQIFSGSAFRMACAIAPDKFTLTQGTPKQFDKTADSGKIRQMLFCGECGTHLCSMPTVEEEGSFVSLRIATAEQFGELAPVAELYCDSRVSWMPALQNTVCFAGMPAS